MLADGCQHICILRNSFRPTGFSLPDIEAWRYDLLRYVTVQVTLRTRHFSRTDIPNLLFWDVTTTPVLQYVPSHITMTAWCRRTLP